MNTNHVWKSPEEYFRTQYFEIIDRMINGLEDRFDQTTFQYLMSIEQLIIDAANGEMPLDVCNELKEALRGDIEIDQLVKELNMLSSVVKSADPGIKRVTSLRTIMNIFRSQPHLDLRKVYCNLHALMKMYLTVPLSNASAERSFSALRRIKNYLRNRLTQEHLNHYMMLNVHKHLTEIIDLNIVAKTFVSSNERRLNFFGKF